MALGLLENKSKSEHFLKSYFPHLLPLLTAPPTPRENLQVAEKHLPPEEKRVVGRRSCNPCAVARVCEFGGGEGVEELHPQVWRLISYSSSPSECPELSLGQPEWDKVSKVAIFFNL